MVQLLLRVGTNIFLPKISEKFVHLEPSKEQMQRCAAIEAYEQNMGAPIQKTTQQNAKNGIEIERPHTPERDASSIRDVANQRPRKCL